MLIEFGGVDNTFEELYRSSDALAEVFSEYYWQAEQVNQTASPTAE
jgi:stage II sporulation protein P